LTVADFNGDAKPDLAARPPLGTAPDALLLNTTPYSPLAATVSARHLTRHSARLRGTVNPRGSATRYRFSYGRTRHYSHTTQWRDAGSAKQKLTSAYPLRSDRRHI
jgi:hypothetical protein